MDAIDKRIFLRNFKGHLRGNYIVDTLESVKQEIIRTNDLAGVNTSINEKQIEKLKQIVWLLEAEL